MAARTASQQTQGGRCVRPDAFGKLPTISVADGLLGARWYYSSADDWSGSGPARCPANGEVLRA